ncbi:MAG TPA: hypothetical protein VD838_04770, partial [Anaeromyxobacteraceae bacterium]|nr:hypothetical protein [Anaeromyxobacteraceae bacterium]
DGHAWLEATARALTRGSDWRDALAALEREEALSPGLRRRHLDELRLVLEAGERAARPATPPSTLLRDELPAALEGRPLSAGAAFRLERVRGAAPAGRVVIRRGEPVDVAGWSFAPGLDARRSQTFLLLQSPNHERTFVAPVPVRSRRDDVAFRHRELDPRTTTLSGFEVRLETGAVAPGEYRLACAHTDGQRVVASVSEHRVVVER